MTVATMAVGENQDRLRDWPRAVPGVMEGLYEVRVGCIGREQAGKTALFRALNEGPIGEYFPSGLSLEIGDPKAVARMIRVAEETRRLLEMSGLPPTLDATCSRYFLCDGDEQRVALDVREVIGQVLTHTLPDSAPEMQARYDEYLKNLLDTDVLWVVIPCPPSNPTPQDRRRYGNDLRIASAYLREALRRRPADQPCAVALVISKIDTLFADAADAKATLTAELLGAALAPLINSVRQSRRVTEAAIFPITAFGFGTAVPQQEKPAGDARNPDDPFRDEPVWLLKEGGSQQPVNLSALVLWTLLGGLLHQEVRHSKKDGEPEIARIVRMLREDLQGESHWLVNIKAQGTSS